VVGSSGDDVSGGVGSVDFVFIQDDSVVLQNGVF